jgi:hypothetical protein
MIQKFTFLILFFLALGTVAAQNVTVRGFVRDAENDAPLADASVVLGSTGRVAGTDATGAFVLEDVQPGLQVFIVSHAGYLPRDQRINIGTQGTEDFTILLRKDPSGATNATDIPTVTLDEAEEQTEGAGEVPNALHSSRDVFQTISGFGWFNFRFRERGYDSEFFPLYINNINMNDPETGFSAFSEISGLNDVLRNRESTVGLEAAEFSYSDIGGASRIDTRAAVQRKQTRASYAVSNRVYRNRVMLTSTTGLMPGGWAVALSGSYRWAEEGYFEGTFFEGYSWFASVDKKFNPRHSLNLTLFNAPSKRGRNADTFQEMYDLAGTIRYNPMWGWQDGRKRNSNVATNSSPTAILRYDFNPAAGTNIVFSAYGQKSRRGFTRLEWNEAQNPNPDFNRILPSSVEDPILREVWADSMRNNENLRQVDWLSFYEANRNSAETIFDADGTPGNTVTGNRSQYIVEDQRSDSDEAGFNGVLTQQLNNRMRLFAGVNYKWYRGKNFKTLQDLLGGDYWLDINRFAAQDLPGDVRAPHNDLQNINNVVRKDEVFGYNYNEEIRQSGSWLQVTGDQRKFSWFGAADLGLTQFWRVGFMQTGRFPDNSLGKSPKNSYYTYGVKGGLTYKISGRNYLYTNASIGTKAPQFRNIYISPRTRDEVVPNIDPYTVKSIEGGYLRRSPRLKGRITGYYTRFEDRVESFQVFFPTVGLFGTNVLTGIQRVHSGVEAAFEYKPFPQWTVSAGTNLGYYRDVARPKLFTTVDNTGAQDLVDVTVYQKNFLTPRTPQTAASAAVRYEGKKFWSASLTLNWVDDNYFQYNPRRRTADFVLGQNPDTDIWNTIIVQEKAPAAYTVDFFASKSWRIFGNRFLYLNAGINNILDNRNIIISGREAFRAAFGRTPDNQNFYTSEVSYAPGINYFIQMAVRL